MSGNPEKDLLFSLSSQNFQEVLPKVNWLKRRVCVDDREVPQSKLKEPREKSDSWYPSEERSFRTDCHKRLGVENMPICTITITGRDNHSLPVGRGGINRFSKERPKEGPARKGNGDRKGTVSHERCLYSP